MVKPWAEIEDNKQIEVLYNAMRYELEDGENVQSINDNEAGFEDMYSILRKFSTKILNGGMVFMKL